MPGSVTCVRQRRKAQVAPLHRRRIHLKPAANGQCFLSAVVIDEEDVSQTLAHLFANILLRDGSLIRVPVTKLCQADAARLLLHNDIHRFCGPGKITMLAQNYPRLGWRTFGAEQKRDPAKVLLARGRVDQTVLL